MSRKKAFTLVELLGVMVILGAILLVTVPSITKTLKNKKEEEYQRFLNDIYLATESYIGMRAAQYTELTYSNKAVVELKELIEAGYISDNKVNPQTKEVINPLETVEITKSDKGIYSFALSGKENGKSSYIKEGLLLWLDGKEHGEEEFVWRDLSGNGNHGTLKGFENNSHKLWDNNSLYFDGINDLVTTTQINPTYVTLEITVMPLKMPVVPPNSNRNYIIGNWESGGYGIGLFENGNIMFETYTTGYTSLIQPSVYQLQNIYHIVATYDGTKERLWVNGVKQSVEMDVTGEINPPISNTSVALGVNPKSDNLQSNPSNVNIYSARIYNRALTETEIKKNYEIEKMRFGI